MKKLMITVLGVLFISSLTYAAPKCRVHKHVTICNVQHKPHKTLCRVRHISKTTPCYRLFLHKKTHKHRHRKT